MPPTTPSLPVDEQIRRLEERAGELEAQLSAVRSQLSSLYSMHPGEHRAGNETSGLPGITIQPLRPYDRLRTKWNLGTGLDIPQKAEAAAIPPPQSESSFLRLFGLLTHGEPWEVRIPFSRLADPRGVRLGRDSSCSDITLPDSSISRCHLLIELTEQGLAITDRNSTNGTAINGQPLASYQNRYPLQNSDTLSLGDIMLQAEIIRTQN